MVAEPALPAEVGRIQIRGVCAFGHRWDVDAVGTEGYVRLARDPDRPPD
ncbi:MULTISPECIES: hypothetical protein [Micromonospora]|nr:MULTISPECIES: hypothetical protein [unclassified Micromonospora]MBM0228255.1 hypothetical protein [Micromonospora sp. ATA51]